MRCLGIFVEPFTLQGGNVSQAVVHRVLATEAAGFSFVTVERIRCSEYTVSLLFFDSPLRKEVRGANKVDKEHF